MNQLKKLWLFLFIFFILSLILMNNHESWRDEAQAWLISRDSPNIVSVVNMMGYEGTPALWHILVYPFAKMNFPYITMRIIHILVALAIAIIILGFSPFTSLHKILLVFGYYIFYEYNIIARHYVFFALFLLLIALFYKERFQKVLLYGILIFLLVNSSLQGFVIGIFLGMHFFYEIIFRQHIKITVRHITLFIIMVFAYIIVLGQIATPKDLAPYAKEWHVELTLEHFSQIGTVLIGAFLPIPEVKLNFWNSLVLNYSPQISIIIGVLMLLLSLLFFTRNFKAMVLYLIFFLGLTGIIILKVRGVYVRHYGEIFLIFIFCLWISRNEEEKYFVKNAVINNIFNKKILSYILSFLLIVQLIASLIALHYDLNYDFSSGKKVAQFLKDNKFTGNNTFIATYHSYATSSVLPYLPTSKSQFFCVEYRELRSFMTWNEEYALSNRLNLNQIIERVDKEISGKNYKTMLLILNENVGPGFSVMNPKTNQYIPPSERYKYELIAAFDKTIVPDESLYVYRITQ